MDTTVGSAIEQARNRLRPLFRETLNLLRADLSDTTGTTVSFTNSAEGITVGATIGIDTEDMVVMTPVVNGQCTVARAQHGTQGATHTAGTVVEVRPAHSRGMLLQALLEEIRTWPPDLFVPKRLPVNTVINKLSYDLGLTDQTDIIDSLALWDPTNDTVRLGARAVPHTIIRNAPTSISPTNKVALVLDWTPRYTVELSLEYAAPFTLGAFVVGTDLVGTVGLAVSMFDLAWMGAARRRITELPRVDTGTQPDPRLPDEVPGGLVTRVRQQLDDEYMRRRAMEIQKLLRRWPARSS